MKKLVLLVLVMALVPWVNAGYVLSFNSTGSGVGKLSISTDATGGTRGLIGLIAMNPVPTATISHYGEVVSVPFNVVDTGIWNVPLAPYGYNGYLGAIGGDLNTMTYQFVPAIDGQNYATLTNMNVMSNIGVTFSQPTTFVLLWFGNAAYNTPAPIASVDVPEPATMALLGLGGLLLRRRKA